MRQLDKFETIANNAPVGCCCVVLGNIPAGDFALVDPSLAPLPVSTVADFHARGLGFIATFGIAGGKFVSAFAAPVSDQLATLLYQDYAVFLSKKFAPKRGGDGAEWLAKLFALPDTRDAERQALIDEYDDSNDNEC